MNRRPAVQLPHVPGIDLTFRPDSYFWPMGLETHLLTRIKGATRRAALQHLIATKQLGAIPTLLRESALGEEDRQALGRIHPAFMGGEYLPDLSGNEVMIARITIASTTQDVTSVYARGGNTRYQSFRKEGPNPDSDRSRIPLGTEAYVRAIRLGFVCGNGTVLAGTTSGHGVQRLTCPRWRRTS